MQINRPRPMRHLDLSAGAEQEPDLDFESRVISTFEECLRELLFTLLQAHVRQGALPGWVVLAREDSEDGDYIYVAQLEVFRCISRFAYEIQATLWKFKILHNDFLGEETSLVQGIAAISYDHVSQPLGFTEAEIQARNTEVKIAPPKATSSPFTGPDMRGLSTFSNSRFGPETLGECVVSSPEGSNRPTYQWLRQGRIFDRYV